MTVNTIRRNHQFFSPKGEYVHSRREASVASASYGSNLTRTFVPEGGVFDSPILRSNTGMAPQIRPLQGRLNSLAPYPWAALAALVDPRLCEWSPFGGALKNGGQTSPGSTPYHPQDGKRIAAWGKAMLLPITYSSATTTHRKPVYPARSSGEAAARKAV